MKINEEIITSRKNPKITFAASLSDKKEREKNRLFKTDGKKLAKELFDRGITPETVFIKESSAGALLPEFEGTKGCDAYIISDGAFDKISEEKSPDGIICIVKYLDNFRKINTIEKDGALSDEWKNGKILLLQSIRDPGNFGTIIRSAAAFGVTRVIASGDCADVYNPKTLRASMGAMFGVKVDMVDDLGRAVEMLKGLKRRVFATALDREAVKLGSFELSPTDCFVIGNEGHGLSEDIIGKCDGSVFIPMTNGAESLNAAAAATVVLWETFKV